MNEFEVNAAYSEIICAAYTTEEIEYLEALADVVFEDGDS